MLTRIDVTNYTLEELYKMGDEGWAIEINNGQVVATKEISLEETAESTAA